MKTESKDITKYAICSIKWKNSGEIEDGCIFKLSLDLDEQDEEAKFIADCKVDKDLHDRAKSVALLVKVIRNQKNNIR